MARARNIKPGFFVNEQLGECSPLARLLFVGLWCLADREGRLEDRPRRIKASILPYDSCDADALLRELQDARFILRYQVGDRGYIQIISFTKHQQPHHKEVGSEIPAPDGTPQITRHPYDVPNEQRARIFARDGQRCLKCKSKDSLSIDHIIPLASGGDNADDNLQTLCSKCNSSKSDTTKDYRPSLSQRSGNDGASFPTDSRNRIPSSLNPHSLNPDTVLPDSEPKTRAVAGFGKIQSDKDLKDTGKVLSLVSPHAAEVEQLRILGAAERALDVGKHPPAVFVKIVKAKDWHLISEEQDERARRRLRDHNARAGPAAASLVANAFKIPEEPP